MTRYSLITVTLCLFPAITQAQVLPGQKQSPAVNDFAGTLSFLSSDWMEGREAGARGGFMAADYIASMMQLYGLAPSGDLDQSNNTRDKKPGSNSTFKRTYFQNFEVVRYKTDKETFAFIQRTSTSESALQLSAGTDFELRSGPYGREAETGVVFAGYGITAPDKAYDDYKGQDVKGRIVVVLDGFPGHADTTSPAWKKLGKAFGEKHASVDEKLRIAEQHGAVALILVAANGSIRPLSHSQMNRNILNSVMNSPKITEPEYDDPDYILPGDTTIAIAPCFSLGPDATSQLFAGTGIVLTGFETKIAHDLSPAPMPLKDKIIRFCVSVKQESIGVHNVLGMIQGKDSSRSIVVGAHYDHLGIRNGNIYNGADDNASGVSGMLALAKVWSENCERPACNIIFAAWTAEEKGLLGSSYFVQHTRANPGKIKLSVNLDMISRSAPEDTDCRILSIGTMKGNEYLQHMAAEGNLRLSHPFKLDLWDVTGHFGSDYASFTAVKIPVMTFFSGFHDDYHTPRDISAKTDPGKMESILKLVNGCIRQALDSIQSK